MVQARVIKIGDSRLARAAIQAVSAFARIKGCCLAVVVAASQGVGIAGAANSSDVDQRVRKPESVADDLVGGQSQINTDRIGRVVVVSDVSAAAAIDRVVACATSEPLDAQVLGCLPGPPLQSGGHRMRTL